MEITKLLVENISLPPAVEDALDKRTSMGVIGNLKDYSEFQAAENTSGGASEGIGMGIGFAMTNKMGQSYTPPQASNSTVSPPPIPQHAQYFIAINGQQSGPFDLNVLQNKIKAAEISKETLVWSQKLVEWTKAGKVAELAAFFPMPPLCPLEIRNKLRQP
ncbi:GYF domain-containing protein [Bathymodiolus japonicus methanotrophic gill symbiont]|uniref:GYF domain-containing protein n=1 Tax=Bathymodiolus japonicus methanotrophic gill symbiont TaxID=113269 RepID=UPI003B82F5A9